MLQEQNTLLSSELNVFAISIVQFSSTSRRSLIKWNKFIALPNFCFHRISIQNWVWKCRSLSAWMGYTKWVLPSIWRCVCVNSYKFLGRKTIIHIHSLLKQLVQFQFMASVIFFHTFMGLCFQVQRHEDTFCMVVTVIAAKVRLFPMWLSFEHTQKLQHNLVGRFFFCPQCSNNLIISKWFCIGIFHLFIHSKCFAVWNYWMFRPMNRWIIFMLLTVYA